MTSQWRLFTNAHREEGARKVGNRILDGIGVSGAEMRISPYYKGGFVLEWDIEHDEDRWPYVVIQLLALAQSVGRDWRFSGAIEHELGLWSSSVSASGATALHVSAMRCDE